MKLGFEKRQRIAKIFGRTAEYAISILILGSVIAGKSNIAVVLSGIFLFVFFFTISVLAEPEKEG